MRERYYRQMSPGRKRSFIERMARRLLRPFFLTYTNVISWLAKKTTPAKSTDPMTGIQQLLMAIKENPDRITDRPVLDIGGGRGVHQHLFDNLGSSYYIVEPDVDNYPGELKRTQTIAADGHWLPFASGSCGVITLIEVLEHVYNPQQFVAECSRVLAPSGILLATVPQYIHIHGWPSDYYRYTGYGLRYLCEANGLDVIKLIPMGGPMMVLYRAIEINFSLYTRPLLRFLIGNPMAVIFQVLDRLLFPHNMQRKNPDVAHWALLAQKHITERVRQCVKQIR